MRLFKLMLSLMIVLACLSTVVHAGDGALALDSSSVTNGQTQVSVTASIDLVFSNNVINATVRENNMGCFSLMRGNDQVAIDIVMADDQVQPDLKRIIHIVPKQALEKGQSYKLILTHALAAKNGSTLEKDITIAFKTEGTSFPIGAVIGLVIGLVLVLLAVTILIVAGKRKKKLRAS